MGRYLEAAKVVRAAMDAAAAVLTDEQALRAVALYPAWDGAAQYGASHLIVQYSAKKFAVRYFPRRFFAL